MYFGCKDGKKDGYFFIDIIVILDGILCEDSMPKRIAKAQPPAPHEFDHDIHTLPRRPGFITTGLFQQADDLVRRRHHLTCVTDQKSLSQGASGYPLAFFVKKNQNSTIKWMAIEIEWRRGGGMRRLWRNILGVGRQCWAVVANCSGGVLRRLQQKYSDDGIVLASASDVIEAKG